MWCLSYDEHGDDEHAEKNDEPKKTTINDMLEDCLVLESALRCTGFFCNCLRFWFLIIDPISSQHYTKFMSNITRHCSLLMMTTKNKGGDRKNANFSFIAPTEPFEKKTT